MGQNSRAGRRIWCHGKQQEEAAVRRRGGGGGVSSSKEPVEEEGQSREPEQNATSRAKAVWVDTWCRVFPSTVQGSQLLPPQHCLSFSNPGYLYTPPATYTVGIPTLQFPHTVMSTRPKQGLPILRILRLYNYPECGYLHWPILFHHYVYVFYSSVHILNLPKRRPILWNLYEYHHRSIHLTSMPIIHLPNTSKLVLSKRKHERNFKHLVFPGVPSGDDHSKKHLSLSLSNKSQNAAADVDPITGIRTESESGW